MDSFGSYLKAEIEAMKAFQRTESERQGRELTRNEAAALWAHTAAAKFRAEYNELYREGDINGRPGSQGASTSKP